MEMGTRSRTFANSVRRAALLLPLVLFLEDVRNSVETSGPPGPLVYAARA